MNALEVVKLAGAVVGLLVAVGAPTWVPALLRSTFPNQKERLHAEIERKADLLTKLPAGSKAHTILQTSIEKDLRRLVDDLSESRRDPASIVLGLAFIAVGLGGGWLAFELDSWWWKVPVGFIAVVFVLFGIFGFTQGALDARRDEKGNPIPAAKADSAGGEL